MSSHNLQPRLAAMPHTSKHDNNDHMATAGNPRNFIQDVPDEILCLFARAMPPADLRNFRLTCVRVEAATHMIWKQKCNRDLVIQVTDSRLARVLRDMGKPFNGVPLTKYVRTVTVVFQPCQYYSKSRTGNYLIQIMRAFKHLESLTIQGPTSTDLSGDEWVLLKDFLELLQADLSWPTPLCIDTLILRDTHYALISPFELARSVNAKTVATSNVSPCPCWVDFWDEYHNDSESTNTWTLDQLVIYDAVTKRRRLRFEFRNSEYRHPEDERRRQASMLGAKAAALRAAVAEGIAARDEWLAARRHPPGRRRSI